MAKRYKLNWTDQGLKTLRDGINRRKPWLKSTGPRTIEGNRRSRQNALETGMRASKPKVVTDRVQAGLRFSRARLSLSTALRLIQKPDTEPSEAENKQPDRQMQNVEQWRSRHRELQEEAEESSGQPQRRE